MSTRPTDDPAPYLRIGELSRRVGVTSELLRAWERRYGVLSPTRTTGGFRLYGDGDERRVQRMLHHLETGVSAAEAARLVLAEQRGGGDDPAEVLPEVAGDVLRLPLERFDEAAAATCFDRLLAAFGLDTVLRDVVLPCLRQLGERWERGEVSIAQEHFASGFLRGRLLGLARGWDGGHGPRALLACAPGEQHDLGLICFGLALRGLGWRITFLGADTPFATIAETARSLAPDAVVVSFTYVDAGAATAELAELGAAAPLLLAGRRASAALAAGAGARYVADDPFTAAAALARGAVTGRR